MSDNLDRAWAAGFRGQQESLKEWLGFKALMEFVEEANGLTLEEEMNDLNDMVRSLSSASGPQRRRMLHYLNQKFGDKCSACLGWRAPR